MAWTYKDLLIRQRSQLIESIKSELKQLAELDATDVTTFAETVKNECEKIRDLADDLLRVHEQLTRLPPGQPPRPPLADVRERLQDEVEVWSEYARKYPNVRAFKEVANTLKIALEDFNDRNYKDAYYDIVEATYILYENRQEVEPILVKEEGQQGMFDVEVDSLYELANDVLDMMWKGERLGEVAAWKQRFRGVGR